MSDLPRPGIEPLSPTLAGRLFTTEPPGKPIGRVLKQAVAPVYVSSPLFTLLPGKQLVQDGPENGQCHQSGDCSRNE